MQHGSSIPLRHRTGRRVAVVIAAVAVVAIVAAVVVAHLSDTGVITSPLGGDTQASDETMRDRYPMTPSTVDFDGDGVDDYTDILAGARKDAEAAPTYDDGYYQGGYPPADRGACTDVVWRAFAEAGYDLKAMVDADIAAYPADYANAAPAPDPNIDFRRTGVLDVFLSKYAQTLTTDTSDTAAWQGGDIVVFEYTRHIGVVSDLRDGDGLPFIIHNMGQRQRENDYLVFRKHMAVSGHYRFDASQVPQDVLRPWNG